MQLNRSRFSLLRIFLSFGFTAAVAAALLFSIPSLLFAQHPEVVEPAGGPYVSGQTRTQKGLVQVALDGETGNIVFILTPDKAPAPTHANATAQAPIYLITYPDPKDIPSGLSYDGTTYDASKDAPVPANELACTVTNCKGLNVLPMSVAAYGGLHGTNDLCEDFNGGKSCSPVEGHDHLLGTPYTRGDFNVAWHKVVVVFTPKGIVNGAAHTRITTIDQLNSDYMNGYVKKMKVPDSSFNCSLVPEQLYYEGTPVYVNYPDPDSSTETGEQ